MKQFKKRVADIKANAQELELEEFKSDSTEAMKLSFAAQIQFICEKFERMIEHREKRKYVEPEKELV